MKLLTEAYLTEVTNYVMSLYEEIQHIHESVKLGNEEVISRSMAAGLMGVSKGRRLWFTVEFIKRSTNSIRRINGMTGVRKYVKGVGLPYDQKAKGLITIFDKNAPGTGAQKYRQVPLDSITRLAINRRVFKVIDDSEYASLVSRNDSNIEEPTTEPVDQKPTTTSNKRSIPSKEPEQKPEPQRRVSTEPKAADLSKPGDKRTINPQPQSRPEDEDDREGSDR